MQDILPKQLKIKQIFIEIHFTKHDSNLLTNIQNLLSKYNYTLYDNYTYNLNQFVIQEEIKKTVEKNNAKVATLWKINKNINQ